MAGALGNVQAVPLRAARKLCHSSSALTRQCRRLSRCCFGKKRLENKIHGKAAVSVTFCSLLCQELGSLRSQNQLSPNTGCRRASLRTRSMPGQDVPVRIAIGRRVTASSVKTCCCLTWPRVSSAILHPGKPVRSVYRATAITIEQNSPKAYRTIWKAGRLCLERGDSGT